MNQHDAVHITTSTTTTITTKPCHLRSLEVVVLQPGTNWTLRINNREGTPKVIYMNTGTGVSAGPDYVDFPGLVLMRNGIDVVTTGATPGVLDVFACFVKTENE